MRITEITLGWSGDQRWELPERQELKEKESEDVRKIGKRELLTDHQWCGHMGLL